MDDVIAAQKFHCGDLVRIITPDSILFQHEVGQLALVMGSYREIYGTKSTEAYALMTQSGDRRAWYNPDQLALVRKGNYFELKFHERAASN